MNLISQDQENWCLTNNRLMQSDQVYQRQETQDPIEHGANRTKSFLY